MDIRTIARVMGGNVINRTSVSVPGPGHSPKDRSLKVTVKSDGRFSVTTYAGDDWRACKDHVRERLGLEPWGSGQRRERATPFAVTDSGPDPQKERNKAFALRIWEESVDPRGTLVERYLREQRGLSLPTEIAGSVIRFHAALYYDPQTRHPGMVCLLRNIETDEPTGIHRTYLNRYTAEKIDRKMFGIAKGSAIKLDPESGDTITIGEGVETVMSAREAGYRPAWALGSSGAVKTFPVLKRPAEITILEENDPTSRRDVKTCAKRYLAARKPVNIVSSRIGNDINDAWRAMHR